MDQSYPKKEKLKSQKLIEKLFAEGKGITVFPIKLIYLKIDSNNQVGVSASKKNFKKAVDRNRIKRLLRETYRLNKNLLIDNNVQGYALMILYLGRDLPDFNTVNQTIQKVFTELIERTLSLN